jgi:hypothetical protein
MRCLPLIDWPKSASGGISVLHLLHFVQDFWPLLFIGLSLMLLSAVWLRAANRICLFIASRFYGNFFAALAVHCGSRASLIIYWSRSTFFAGWNNHR